MAIDCGLIDFAKANLLNLCDISMILNLSCVLHMLKYVNALMQFVQTKNVVYDYVANVKTCQIYTKYTVIWTPPFKLHKISFEFIMLLQMCLQGLNKT
jgi:hypothetical protein